MDFAILIFLAVAVLLFGMVLVIMAVSISRWSKRTPGSSSGGGVDSGSGSGWLGWPGDSGSAGSSSHDCSHGHGSHHPGSSHSHGSHHGDFGGGHHGGFDAGGHGGGFDGGGHH